MTFNTPHTKIADLKYLTVRRNHENYTRPENALYIEGGIEGGNADYYEAFSLEEAKQIAAAILEVVSDFEEAIEANKPKPLTSTQLVALPVGSTVYNHYRAYMKLSDGKGFVKVKDIAEHIIFPIGTIYDINAIANSVYAEEVN